MSFLKQNFLVTLVFIAIYLGIFGVKPQCHAQNISASDEVNQKYLELNTDTTTYQIITQDKHEEYMSYYRAIRKKILAKLKRNYTGNYNDGDVHLYFVLDKKGELIRIDVALNRSTKDTKLIDIALRSLQQAAPFGPFPEEFKGSGQIPFSVTVTFKKNNK